MDGSVGMQTQLRAKRQLDVLRFQRSMATRFRPDRVLWPGVVLDPTPIRSASLSITFPQYSRSNTMATTVTVSAELPSVPPTAHNSAINPPPRAHHSYPLFELDLTYRIRSCIQSSTATSISTDFDVSHYAVQDSD